MVGGIADPGAGPPGGHRARNAPAAIAVAPELGIDDSVIRRGPAAFGGVKRRFTPAGDWNGVTLIDDYPHHPVEISPVLRAPREATHGRVLARVPPPPLTPDATPFEPVRTWLHD